MAFCSASLSREEDAATSECEFRSPLPPIDEFDEIDDAEECLLFCENADLDFDLERDFDRSLLLRPPISYNSNVWKFQKFSVIPNFT